MNDVIKQWPGSHRQSVHQMTLSGAINASVVCQGAFLTALTNFNRIAKQKPETRI